MWLLQKTGSLQWTLSVEWEILQQTAQRKAASLPAWSIFLSSFAVLHEFLRCLLLPALTISSLSGCLFFSIVPIPGRVCDSISIPLLHVSSSADQICILDNRVLVVWIADSSQLTASMVGMTPLFPHIWRGFPQYPVVPKRTSNGKKKKKTTIGDYRNGRRGPKQRAHDIFWGHWINMSRTMSIT